MALLSTNHLEVATIKPEKLNLKPSCPECQEEFDAHVHIPKVMKCGHTTCSACIKSFIDSIKVVNCGNSDDVHTFLKCPMCSTTMAISDKGVNGFATNYAVIEAASSSDLRMLECSNCKMTANESTFRICRECVIEKNGYDVQSILNSDPEIHPDNYVICSTCVLEFHNSPAHTIIHYLPIRLNYQAHRNLNSVNVLTATMVENFAEVRTVLATLPLIVNRKEQEVSKLVECMQRAKNSQSQMKIFEKYKQYMDEIIKTLDVLSRDGGKLNEMVKVKTDMLAVETEQIGALHCFSEIPKLQDLFKLRTEEEVATLPEISEAENISKHNAQNDEIELEVESPSPPAVQIPLPQVVEEHVQVPVAENICLTVLTRILELIFIGITRMFNYLIEVANSVDNNNEAPGRINRQTIMLTIVCNVALIFIYLLLKMFS